ncbi:hypothetical protein ME805_14090 [Lactobacillus delbrueckii]|nr:hypothetical protein ME803_14720 [Lactobacillus delbrueckii]GHN59185.1 hypothetical protein ME805_14090 [Lactobacillus delbrueckii]GHN60407.1 hypothetical protein ME806_07030 [Lactobacillus delbrueckii]
MGIKAVGKYKLVITLERWIPYFDKLMGFGVFLPQSEKAVKRSTALNTVRLPST